MSAHCTNMGDQLHHECGAFFARSRPLARKTAVRKQLRQLFGDAEKPHLWLHLRRIIRGFQALNLGAQSCNLVSPGATRYTNTCLIHGSYYEPHPQTRAIALVALGAMNPLHAHTTPIPAPSAVRLGASLLAGLAVAVGTSRIHFGLALGLSLLFLLTACALVLLHPYRADLRDYAQRHNVTMLPNTAQLIPLMVLWLAVMFSPLLALPAWGSARSGCSLPVPPSGSSPTSTAPASSLTRPRRRLGLPKPVSI